MIITIKKKENDGVKISYFKASCRCGGEFIFTSQDISSEKRINGAKWVTCPECGNCIYWSANYISDQITNISEEEYNELLKKFGEKSSE